MKRILSFLLSLCMVVSLLPVSLFTATEVSAEPTAHSHYACSCAIAGGNACAGHGSDPALTWQEWTDTATLPTTTGNYYLTGNITLTNIAAMTIAADQVVNLCLNGFSVQFNSANTSANNYSVAAGAKLTVMNCQAKLDSKGLLVCGNKANTSDLTAGRLYGGRASTGGAIYVLGEVNLYGVELYDNGKPAADASTYGGAVRLGAGGVLNAVHAKFDSNKARYGAAIGNNAKDVNITLDDTILSNNNAAGTSSGNGGAIYFKAFAAATQDCVLTIKGDSRLTGNQSYSSGCAIYVSSENKAAAATNCRVVLQDNVVISGNEATRTSGAAKGAVSMDTGKDSGKASVLAVSGNVQIKDNTLNSTNTSNAENVCFTNVQVKLEVGEMGEKAYISVRTSADYTDPDSFIVKAASANIADNTSLGIVYENSNKGIYYKQDGAAYFGDVPALPVDHVDHHACSCALTGGNACAGHGSDPALTWQEWTDTTTLPTTTGNYYLTGNITLTNTAAMTIAADQVVNLCLNGHSVQFNSANTAAANYSVAAGAKLTIMNCQAELDSKGLLVSDGTGRLTGGKGNKGGAIYAAGQVNLIGVEFYNNGVSNSGSGGVMQLAGGTLHAVHTKFDSNKAKTGAVIATVTTNATVTLDDVIVSNNVAGNSSSGNGGLAYWKAFTTATAYNTMTIKGDSQITGNSSGGSGGVLYICTEGGASATAANRVILQDNVVITNNTTGTGSAKGAIAMDAASATGAVSYLSVSGNVQIKDNIAQKTGTVATDVYLHNAKNKVEVGQMGADADVRVRTNYSADAPNQFMLKASGVTIADDTDTHVNCMNTDPAKDIYYNTTDGFYYYTAPVTPPVVQPDHFHHACSCAITGGNACAGHGTNAEPGWVAWTDTATLPTETGNYYLTGDITLTNTAAMTVAAGQDVKLCLNGHSVQFNADYSTDTANYSVAAGAKLTVMNCQAKLGTDGLLISGNKADANDLTAGRLTGGKSKKGGAIYAEGEVNLLGVELYANGLPGASNGTGGAVQLAGDAVLNAVHTKFDSNLARYGGAIGNVGGNVNITLEDTVLSNNETVSSSAGNGGAIYLKTAASTTQAIKLTIKGDSKLTGNRSYSSGSAIYVSRDGATPAAAACDVVLQDDVQITGNASTRSTGAARGAVSLDAASTAGIKAFTIAVSGNVQIKDNTAVSTGAGTAKNLNLTNTNNQLMVGQLADTADIRVFTPTAYSDPDSFMQKAEGITLQEKNDIGVTYETVDPALAVGYSSAESFYLYDPNYIPLPPHIHHACACVLTGQTGCTHGAELEWEPWTQTDTLPTSEGNYYLTDNVQMTGGVSISKKVNICLNGFSVKFDETYTSSTSINAKAGSELTIMNCQAVVDENDLLVCGNQADQADKVAGRLYNGRGKWGGAIYVGGTVNLIGVELYDNRSSNSSSNFGGAVYITEGALNTYSTNFVNNFAKSGGAIANAVGNVAIHLHDTQITNVKENTAASGGAIYLRVYKDGNSDSDKTTVDPTLTISGNSRIYGNYTTGSGAAIYVCRDSEAPKNITAQLALKDNVVITDNHGGSAKGALALDTTAADHLLYLDISGNVQIFGNTSTAGNGNVYLNAARHQIRVGKLGEKTKIYVTTSGAQGDPDGFLKLAEGVKLEDTAKTGFVYENIDPFVPVGYKNDKNVQFYFAADSEVHDHQACACVISGDTTCKHTEAAEWIPWLYDDRLPTTGGNYYLTKDIKVKSTGGAGSVGQFEIKDGQSVNLCMNGFNVEFYEKNTEKGNYYAMTGSQLTIMNCKSKLDKDGKLADNAKTGGVISGGMGRYGGALYVKGDVKLIGVAFKDNQAAHETEGMGGAVRVQDGGKLLVQHCLFENNEAKTNGGAVCSGRGEAELIIEDSVFTNNTAANYGGAVAMNSASSKLTVKDSLITGSKATNTGGGIYAVKCQMTVSGTTISKNEARNGGAAYVSTNSTLTITDSVIEENTGVNCGGLYVMKQSKATLGKGTVIRKNQADAGGGAILQTKAELTFAGGVIENNKSKSGGGMTLWDQSIVYLKDGKIINNEATTGAGGGIYMQSGADLVISGGEISGNKSATYGGGVYANMNDKVKTIDITVSGGEVSGNTTKTAGGGIYALSAKITMSGGKLAGNEAGSGGGLYLGSGSAAGETLGSFTMTGGEISGNKASTGGGAFHSTNSDAVYTGGVITKNVSTTSGGGIHAKKARLVFEKDILITENESKSGGGFCLQNETVLDFKGGKVEKNTGTSGGGAMLWSKSVLNLNGGLIQNNQSTGSGGGVYMQSGSYLYVNDGKIAKNTSTKAGGGVFSNGNNTDRMTIKITGGEVSGNTAGTQGGGVYVGGAKAGSAMTMTGGAVKNNATVEQQGGGMYIAPNCKLTMYGGSVSGNYTEQTGGGVYTKGDCLLYGGYINSNYAKSSGGGIHTNGGKLIVDGAHIDYNKADAYGGGIRAYKETEFEMHSGSVSYNETEQRGGGISLWCNMTMTGGSINYNKVNGTDETRARYGGGIAVTEDGSVYLRPHYTLDITGGEFIGNYCINEGGALYVSGECYLNVSNAVFKDNEAVYGGAIIADNVKNNRAVPSELVVKNCQFTGNKAEEGGAIYGNWSSETTVEDSIFTANTAAKSGGAIHLRSESIGWISTSFFSENAAGQKGAAIYCADDAEFDSLTITGNNSGDGYAFYIEEGGFDGMSVVKAIVKISGDMKVYENIGAKPDMFIAKDAMVHVNYAGLGKDTKINLELAEGILTNTLIGAYNYEGGNLKYTVTYGDRSITDPEPIPVAEPEVEDTTPATEPAATQPGAQSAGLGIGGIAAISGALVVAVIAVIAAVAVKKKKKAADTAEEVVQE